MRSCCRLIVMGVLSLDIAWSEDSKRVVVGGESGEKFAHAFLWDRYSALATTPVPQSRAGLTFGLCSGSSVGSLDGHAKRVNSIDFKQVRGGTLRPCCCSRLTDLFVDPSLPRGNGLRRWRLGFFCRASLQVWAPQPCKCEGEGGVKAS